MSRSHWGVRLLIAFLLSGAVVATAQAQPQGKLYATDAGKCASPDMMTDGLAVFETKIVGLEWQCTAGSGKLTLDGGIVRFNCNAEGTDYQAVYELKSTARGPVLLEYGNHSGSTQLIDCARSTAPAGPRSTSTTGDGPPWPRVIPANAKSDTIRDVITTSSERNGERYYKSYTLILTQGQATTVEVVSEEFDTYLVVTGPWQFRMENDDTRPSPNSAVQFVAPEAGTYTIHVTTALPNTTGVFGMRATRH